MITFLAIIPAVLQILGWLLQWYGASQDTLDKYNALISSAKDDGLISVAANDAFTAQRQAILDRKNKANQAPPAP